MLSCLLLLFDQVSRNYYVGNLFSLGPFAPPVLLPQDGKHFDRYRHRWYSLLQINSKFERYGTDLPHLLVRNYSTTVQYVLYSTLPTYCLYCGVIRSTPTSIVRKKWTGQSSVRSYCTLHAITQTWTMDERMETKKKTQGKDFVVVFTTFASISISLRLRYRLTSY